MRARVIGTTDASTTSGTFATIQGSGGAGDVLSTTITTSGGDVLVSFSASIKHSANSVTSEFRLLRTTGGVPTEEFRVRFADDRAAETMPVGFTHLVTGLAPGDHTFAIQWRKIVGGAADSVQQSAATWNGGVPGRVMVLVELK